MTKLTIKTGTEDDFFRRGRQLARAADRGEVLGIVCRSRQRVCSGAGVAAGYPDRLLHGATTGWRSSGRVGWGCGNVESGVKL